MLHTSCPGNTQLDVTLTLIFLCAISELFAYRLRRFVDLIRALELRDFTADKPALDNCLYDFEILTQKQVSLIRFIIYPHLSESSLLILHPSTFSYDTVWFDHNTQIKHFDEKKAFRYVVASLKLWQLLFQTLKFLTDWVIHYVQLVSKPSTKEK